MEVQQTKHSPLALCAAVACALGIASLILDASTAAEAARDGITRCLQTVIPALFPFLVLSRLFLGTPAADLCRRLLGPVMGPVFRLPPQAAPALVLGLLGGYPLGAKAAADLYRQGYLQKQEAERLLGFCSNAGPAFLFGMVGALLGGPAIAGVLYFIHILSALLSGVVQRPIAPAPSVKRAQPAGVRCNVPEAVSDSVRTMALICGYIVLMQVVSGFLTKALGVWMPEAVRIGLAGLLELTSGCCQLVELEASGLRYCMASGFLAFGGLCVWMQTISVIRPAGLQGNYYLPGKILQSTIAVLLTWAIMVLFPRLLPLEAATAYQGVSNHAGLLQATGAVAGILFTALGAWCIYLKKKAGKQEAYPV